MARKRMIDPKIWDSEQVMRLGPLAFKVYVYLISQADDAGKLSICFPMLTSRVFPFNGVGENEVKDAVIEMDKIGLIILYSVAGKDFVVHPNWTRYQKLDHPSKSDIPDFREEYRYIREDSPKAREGSRKTAPNRIEEKGIEGKGNTASAALETPFLRRVEDGFLKRNGGQFTNWGRERKALNELLEKAKAREAEHHEDLLVSVCARFWKLKQEDQTPKGFWRSQPFLPSALNASSIWDRVLESMRRDEGQEEALKLVEGRAR